MEYEHRKLDAFWQAKWNDHNVFRAVEDPSKPKKYVLDMFPYPSASGLHVGHPLGYIATDIYSRYFRLKGHAVLHPMGWDAFGLPAEQHAIDTGEHPAKLTYRNIANYKKTLQMLGISFDWEREFATCDPDYYKWTQWIFKKLYEKGLAYQAEMLVNWCPALKTVLANEEVIDGKSERGGHPVERVPMRQWMLKITAYAERLLRDLDDLDWPENIKDIQRNWIGRSEGARVNFGLKGRSETIEVFTTRPDTLFGATYVVLSPEHPLVLAITTAEKKESVLSYQQEASRKSDLERTDLAKNKSGVFTGGIAINPVNNAEIPIWISDYVLAGYGTGAIMAVPGHDERDHAFATQFGLSIIQVVQDPDHLDHEIHEEALPTKKGTLIHSGFLNGLSVEDAIKKVTRWLEEQNLGQAQVNYKLRDWLFSRQRYWGEPIPVLKNLNGDVAGLLADQDLPLTLPEVESYEPTGDGRSPLANISSWVERTDEKGQTHYLETHTMPGSAGSSWYFLRYIDPQNALVPFDFDKAKYWMPVDLYVGGQEHAVGHLLYARFWTKVLYDLGVCPVSEPFQRLINQGMILMNGAKMSKSKGNVVNPDTVVETYGADALRVYEMFMGPLTQSREWDDSNLAGTHRFLSRVARAYLSPEGQSLLVDDEPATDSLRVLHKTIKKIGDDIEALSFNTAIAQMMIFINHIYETKCRSKSILEPFLLLLSPFAPHLAEELYFRCINDPRGLKPERVDYHFACTSNWPTYDPALTIDNDVTMGVQVNGKHRGEITIPRGASQDVAVQAAKTIDIVATAIDQSKVKKVIYVPERILNFVIAP